MKEKQDFVGEESSLFGEESSLFGLIRSPTSSSSSSQQSEKCTIRIVVPKDESHENASPYTPRIISIGPLHHDNPRLQPTEKSKHNYLINLLKRSGDGHQKYEALLQRFLEAATELEERARGYYQLSNTITSQDFVDILVLDGCFLVEFFLKGRSPDQNFATMDDLDWKLSMIKHDILLLENQIPFFVLEKLHDVFVEFSGGTGSTTMIEIASDYLYYTELWDQKRNFWAYYETRVITKQIGEASHLLHLYHKILFETEHQPPSSKLRNIRKWTMAVPVLSWLFMIVSFPMFLIHQLFFSNTVYPTRLTSAMELEEAGVRFQGSCMDLRFDRGTLFLPFLTLNHQSFCLLKNLLALELHHPNPILPYVHTYVAFLSDLIKQTGDLKVMEEHHIITTTSDGDGSIRMVRDLLEGGFQNHEAFIMNEGFRWQYPREREEALMKYCQEPRHWWRAKMMKDYFGNPWSILGLLVGAVLLVLTTLQTVFTVSSYYHQKIVQ